MLSVSRDFTDLSQHNPFVKSDFIHFSLVNNTLTHLTLFLTISLFDRSALFYMKQMEKLIFSVQLNKTRNK